MLDIITDVEQLGNRAEEVLDIRKEGKENQKIILDLKDKIREDKLVSLTAPQLGYDKRIFCVAFDNGQDIRTFINPVITQPKGLTMSRETCHSIPGKTYIRPRNTDITLMYTTPTGKIESRRIVGLAAIVIQHCVDHLDGLLLSDIGLEIDEAFDTASEEERNQVIDAYLDSLDIKRKEIQKEIDNDEVLKKASDAIEFLEKVQKGEITLDGKVSVKKADGDSNTTEEELRQ